MGSGPPGNAIVYCAIGRATVYVVDVSNLEKYIVLLRQCGNPLKSKDFNGPRAQVLGFFKTWVLQEGDILHFQNHCKVIIQACGVDTHLVY